MQSMIDALRSILGEPDFYRVLYGNNPTWDYASMMEYFFSALLLCIVVGSIFRILCKWGER